MLIICQPDNQPADFVLLAQHTTTYDCCGYSEAAEYPTVEDIPAGYEQRCLPPQYGKYLNLQQIATGQLLEAQALQQVQAITNQLLLDQLAAEGAVIT